MLFFLSKYVFSFQVTLASQFTAPSKRLGVALGNRSGSNRNDRPRALSEKRTNVFDARNPGLGLRGMMRGIDPAQMLRRHRRSRILDQHQRRSSARSGVLPEHNLRAGAEINQMPRAAATQSHPEPAVPRHISPYSRRSRDAA